MHPLCLVELVIFKMFTISCFQGVFVFCGCEIALTSQSCRKQKLTSLWCGPNCPMIQRPSDLLVTSSVVAEVVSWREASWPTVLKLLTIRSMHVARKTCIQRTLSIAPLSEDEPLVYPTRAMGTLWTFLGSCVHDSEGASKTSGASPSKSPSRYSVAEGDFLYCNIVALSPTMIVRFGPLSEMANRRGVK